MSVDLVLLLIGLSLPGVVIFVRLLEAVSWGRTLVAFRLSLPQTLNAANVAHWLTTVNAATYAPWFSPLPGPPPPARSPPGSACPRPRTGARRP